MGGAGKEGQGRVLAVPCPAIAPHGVGTQGWINLAGLERDAIG
jgi:hypothetical protein